MDKAALGKARQVEGAGVDRVGVAAQDQIRQDLAGGGRVDHAVTAEALAMRLHALPGIGAEGGLCGRCPRAELSLTAGSFWRAYYLLSASRKASRVVPTRAIRVRNVPRATWGCLGTESVAMCPGLVKIMWLSR